MKSFLILCSIFTYNTIIAQDSRQFSFQQINWKIELPNDFIVADSNSGKAVLKEGVDLVEDKSNIKLESSKTIVLIFANKEQNYFSAIITPFDPTTSNWQEEHLNLKINSYQLMKETVPNATIDTSSSNVSIAGLSFDCFKIKLTVEGRIALSVVALWKLYKGYDLGITYSYNDDATKEQIERMLSRSTFLQ